MNIATITKMKYVMFLITTLALGAVIFKKLRYSTYGQPSSTMEMDAGDFHTIRPIHSVSKMVDDITKKTAGRVDDGLNLHVIAKENEHNGPWDEGCQYHKNNPDGGWSEGNSTVEMEEEKEPILPRDREAFESFSDHFNTHFNCLKELGNRDDLERRTKMLSSLKQDLFTFEELVSKDTLHVFSKEINKFKLMLESNTPPPPPPILRE
jgi:hypothetical protein